MVSDSMAVFPEDDTLENIILQFSPEQIKTLKRKLIGRWPWTRSERTALEVGYAVNQVEDCSGINILSYLEENGLPYSRGKHIHFSPLEGGKYRIHISSN